MPQSKTRLQHTSPTERPFYCITGDLSGEGFLVIVDKGTHELLVAEGAESGTVSIIVNPKGVQVQGVSVRPGTRMLDLQPSSSDPMRQAAESVEWLKSGAIGAPRARVNRDVAESARRGLEQTWRRRHGEVLYALTLHPDGSVTLTVCDDDGTASVELSDPLVEQLIERLRSRDRGSNARVLPRQKNER